MAYLDGVAAAMSANRRMPRPVALVDCATPPPSSPTRCSVVDAVSQPAGDDSRCSQPSGTRAVTGAQLTLRQGELSVAVDRILADAGATRTGAPGNAENRIGVQFRNTLPYGIETASASPRGPSVALAGTPVELARSLAMLDAALEKEGDRTSDVYLRCARLSAEWYDLTGTAEK